MTDTSPSASLSGPSLLSPGSYVVVRCTHAGVHAGVLVRLEGQTVELTEARRLWRWVTAGKDFLSGVATWGLAGDSKIGTPIHVVLTEACEIIACTAEAEESIRAWPDHQPD